MAVVSDYDGALVYALPELACEDIPVFSEHSSPGAFSAALGLGTSGWTVLMNGIAYPLRGEFPCLAFISTPHLVRNVSQSEVVRSAEFEKIERFLREHYRDLYLELARSLSELPLENRAQAEHVILEGMARFRDWLEPLEEVWDTVGSLELLGAPDGSRIRLGPLVEDYGRRGHLWTTELSWSVTPLDGSPVVLVDDGCREVLKALFPTQKDAESLLRRATRARKNRLGFEARPPVPRKLRIHGPRVELGDDQGEVGLLEEYGPPRLEFLYQNRTVETNQYEDSEFPRGLMAVVAHPAVRPNELWDGVELGEGLAAAEAAVRENLPALYSRVLEESASPHRVRWLQEYLAYRVARELPPEELADVPLFRRHDGRQVSYAELKQGQRDGFLLCTRMEWPGLTLEGDPVVVRVEPGTTRILVSLFKLQDHEQALRDAAERQRRRSDWERLPREDPIRLPPGLILVRIRLEGLAGEVGLVRGDPGRIRLWLYKEGRPLGSLGLPPERVPRGVVAAVNHDELKPDDEYRGVVECPALENVLDCLGDALPRLHLALAEQLGGGPWGRDAVERYLDWLGFLNRKRGELHPLLWDALAFRDTADQPVSLNMALQKAGLRYVRAVPGPRVPLEPPALKLGDGSLILLTSLLGTERLHSVEEEYAAVLRKQRFLSQPREVLTLPDWVRPEVRSDVEGGQLVLGFDPHRPDSGVSVRVLLDGRYLCLWQFPLEHGPVAGVLDTTVLKVTPDWQDFERDAGAKRLIRQVWAAVKSLAEVVAGDLKARPSGNSARELRLVWGLISDDVVGLRELRAFPTVSGDWCSLADIEEHLLEHRRIGYVEGPLERSVRQQIMVIELPDPGFLPLLEGILGPRQTMNVTEQVQESLLAGPSELELPEGNYLAVAGLAGGRTGSLGLPVLPGQVSRLLLFREGQFQEERERELPVTLVAAVNDDSLTPRASGLGILADHRLRSLEGYLQKEAGRLVEDLIQQWEQGSSELGGYLFQLGARLCCQGPLELLERLLRLPLLEDPAGRRLPLGRLLPRGSYLSQAPFSLESVPELLEEPVPLLSALQRSWLGSWFEGEDLWPELAPRLELNQQQALAEMVLPPGDYLSECSLAGPGAVGLLTDPGAESSVLLCWRRRPVEEIHLEAASAAVRAVLNDDRMTPIGTPARLRRDEVYEAALRAVREASRQLAVGVVASGRYPSFGRVLLARGRLDEELWRLVCEAPLFRRVDGEPLAWNDLNKADPLMYLPAERQVPADLESHFSEVLEQHGRLPCLTAEDQRLLVATGLNPVSDWEDFIFLARRARNLARTPYTGFTLAERFPNERWLATATVEEESFVGEVGLPARASARGVTACVDGLPLEEDLDPGWGPPVLGFIDGSFMPTNDWGGLESREEVVQVLDRVKQTLVQDLCDRFPSPTDPQFFRARESVLDFLGWVVHPGESRANEALAELRLFPMAEGPYARLADVREQLDRFERLLVCRPGEVPDALGELVLLREPGLARLYENLDVPVVHWREAVPVAPPEPPASERLLTDLRSLFRLLREVHNHELCDETIDQLRLGETPANSFCAFDDGLVLNPAHPAVSRLLESDSIEQKRLYYLISGLYSVLNRAREEIEDTHEREFHKQILRTLIGG